MATDRGPVYSTLSDKVQSLKLSHLPDSRHSGRSWIAWTLAAFFACTTLLLALVALHFAENSSPLDEESDDLANASSETADGSAASVSTPRSVASSGDVVLESKGYIIPAHQILVSPKVSGMVMELMVEEGRRVEKGEILAELETTDYHADLSRAKATLAVAYNKLLELERGNRPEEIRQAKAELDESEAQRSQLESAYQRAVKLRANKTVSETDFEQAESQFKAMDRRTERLREAFDLMVKGARAERIDLAKAEVEQAQADVSKTKWRLDNCTIRAPISGTILKKNAEEGNIVNPVAFNGSYSLCDMADLSDLEVELYIQERDVSHVFKGQRCTMRAEAFPERTYNGVVSRLMPIADRAKGAIPVRVKLEVPADEEGMYLKPEMGAVVSFRKREAPEPSTPKTASQP